MYSEIDIALCTFFPENLLNTSPAINWVAHKATIRGKPIQLAARSKRNLDSTVKPQEIGLQNLLDEQRAAPLINTRHKINLARLALNLSLTTQAEKFIHWSRHKYYTIGDKPTNLLARKLVPRKYTLTIPKLRLHNRQPTQNPKFIVWEF